MRILWVLKNLQIGGEQVDALTIGRGLASAGHELIVAAPDGPLRAQLAGMEHVLIPWREDRTKRFTALTRLIGKTKADLVHAIGKYQILETHFAARNRVPVSGSVMSARLPWTIPEDILVTVCMPHLAAFSRRWRVNPPLLVLPPIEMPPESPPADHLWRTDGPRILVVSRLARVFKEEGIDRTMRAVASHSSAELVVVGDGPHRRHYEQVARELATGRIHFPGAMVDPGPAFAAADIVLGSGGSVLRGLAHGKAAITLGREGFASVVTPATSAALVYQGFFGVGDGPGDPDPLVGMLHELIEDEALQRVAVDEGCRLVRDRYGIEAQLPAILDFVAEAAQRPTPGRWATLRALGRIVHYRVRKGAAKREGVAMGLDRERLQHHIGKKIRELALPPSSFGTGRNLPEEPAGCRDPSGHPAA